ncbi:hypothetical protein BDV06DRAFT_220357 [Aspergillus oleicola]
MSPVEGNAWAQMKAKEQKEQEKQHLDADRGKFHILYSNCIFLLPLDWALTLNTTTEEPSANPPTTHKTSGLDYDSDLAVPMPKPRSPNCAEMPSTTPKSDVLTKPTVTKKRSTTEPPLSTEATSNPEAAEKKKSKVASLRSRFSFKDMGKEYRKEIPPLSSMPKLGGGSGSETKSASSDGEPQSKEAHNFSETKLYVTKSRNGNDAHPKSALPQTSEFRDSSLDNSENSFASCPSLETPRKISEDGQTEAKFEHSLVHNTDGFQGTTNAHLENLLLGGSSPPARTGECNISGHPEIIQAQDRVASMKVENQDLSMPSSPQTPSPRTPADARDYSPSIYDQPKKAAVKASESSLRNRESLKSKKPFIIHSDHDKGKAREEPADDPQRFMDPREPPALPAPAVPSKSQARKAKANVAVENKQNNTGVTSHGGYAPPPPHPGYQNTVTLKKQLASHVDSLHYHVNTAVNKITRTFENGSNWSTDQILRQVDSMSDQVRVLDDRVRVQAQYVSELQPHPINAQGQIAIARNETLLVEERMKSFVQEEMAKLKNELIGLMLSNAGVERAHGSVQDMRSDALHRGGQGSLRSDRRHQQQSKEKLNQLPNGRDDMAGASANGEHNLLVEQNQESKPAPAQKAETSTDKEPDQRSTSNGVPKPTADFRTPRHQPDDTPVPIKREDPSEELFGSPEANPPKKHISNPMPPSVPVVAESSGSKRKSLESNKFPPTPERESASNPRNSFNGENLKTPKKKGGMFSGFRRDKDKKGDGDNHSSGYRLQIRTPRRTKEIRRKSFSGQEGQQGSHFKISTLTKSNTAAAAPSTSSTTTATPLAAGTNIRREDSPSLVHPALRSPQQKQIMVNREQLRLAHLNRQIQNPGSKQLGHGHPLRVSHSHQSFSNQDSAASTATQPSFMSYEHINPRYASGVSVSTSSSMSSFQNVRHYQSNMHYPHPSPPQGLGVGQPQFFAPHLVQQDPNPLMPGHGHGPG